MRVIIVAALLLGAMQGVQALGDEPDMIDRAFAQKEINAYKVSRAFAWCAAYYRLAAAELSFNEDSSHSGSEQYLAKARGAILAGGFLLFVDKGARIANGTTSMPKEGLQLKYFTDRLRVWADSDYEEYERRLNIAYAQMKDDPKDIQYAMELINSKNFQIKKCIDKMDKLQLELIEQVRETGSK